MKDEQETGDGQEGRSGEMAEATGFTDSPEKDSKK